MANLLCCLLLGMGYDAHVVVGSASAAFIQGATEEEPLPTLPARLQPHASDLGAQPVQDADVAKLDAKPMYRPHPKHVVHQSEVAQVCCRHVPCKAWPALWLKAASGNRRHRSVC